MVIKFPCCYVIQHPRKILSNISQTTAVVKPIHVKFSRFNILLATLTNIKPHENNSYKVATQQMYQNTENTQYTNYYKENIVGNS